MDGSSIVRSREACSTFRDKSSDPAFPFALFILDVVCFIVFFLSRVTVDERILFSYARCLRSPVLIFSSFFIVVVARDIASNFSIRRTVFDEKGKPYSTETRSVGRTIFWGKMGG